MEEEDPTYGHPRERGQQYFRTWKIDTQGLTNHRKLISVNVHPTEIIRYTPGVKQNYVLFSVAGENTAQKTLGSISGRENWERIFFLNFNWWIITLQYCDGFCHTSTGISHRHTCDPSFLNSSPTSLPPHPSKLSQSTSFVPYVIYQTLTGYLFYVR